MRPTISISRTSPRTRDATESPIAPPTIVRRVRRLLRSPIVGETASEVVATSHPSEPYSNCSLAPSGPRGNRRVAVWLHGVGGYRADAYRRPSRDRPVGEVGREGLETRDGAIAGGG